jgi:hypothetical protein
MAAEELSYLDYLRAAFRYRPRVGWLGHMPANGMALFTLGLLGFVNPGFWLLGLAGEVAYLGVLSTNSTFQRVVQGNRLLARQHTLEDRVQQTLAGMSGDLRERYRRLVAECGAILGINLALDDGGFGTLRDMRAGGLNQLLWLFLRLLASRDVIATSLAQVDRAAVDAEADRVRARLAKAEPDSALARSLQGTLDIQAKRVENLTKARSSLDVVDAELERIEQQVKLIREEAAVSGGPEVLSSRLDAVTSTLSETSRWMDQHAEFFGSLATDDPDVATLPGLTQLPPAATVAAPPPPPPRQKQRG